MQFEVERKFRISDVEAGQLPARLKSLGFEFIENVLTTDIFLPVEAEDEMLRLRTQESQGETKLLITHKRWVVLSDGHKERQEAEESIGELTKQAILLLAHQIPKEKLPPNQKRRDFYQGLLDGDKCLICLDLAEGIGKYSGHYLEVELLVKDHEGIAEARNKVLGFAEKLLGEAREPEALTYMEMLKASLLAQR